MRRFWIVAGLVLVGGCRQGPPRVVAPDWDPPRIAARALELLDTNGDSTVDSTEAKASPGLAAALRRLDTDKDGRLSESEIQARFEFYEELRTGLVSPTFQVLLNGRPVADAKVEFVPEEFQGGVTEVASGLTDYDGRVTPSIAGEDRPAMRIGFYRVELPAGTASSPAEQRQKTKSVVGVEVSPVSEPDEPGNPVLRFET